MARSLSGRGSVPLKGGRAPALKGKSTLVTKLAGGAPKIDESKSAPFSEGKGSKNR